MTLRLLSRTQILSAKDKLFRDVPTPEWRPAGWVEGDPEAGVRIHSLTRGEIHSARRSAKTAGPGGEVILDEERLEFLLFILSVESDDPFTVDDIELLKDKNSGAFQRVLSEIIDMSGLGTKSVKDAEKSTPNG